jgi:hypothetical protein
VLGPRRIPALVLQVVFLLGGASAALALPPPAPPNAPPPKPGAVLPAATPGPILPVGSILAVVLDDRISSRETPPNTTIRYHLKDALVVGGVTVAPAGSQGTLTVVQGHKAVAPDQDGNVQIALPPFVTLAGALPVRPIHEYLTIDHTAGQLSTRGETDEATDIIVPYAVLYQVFRRGHDLVLPVGSELRLLTAASISAIDPKNVVIATPPPFILSTDPIHADFTPIPLATVPPPFHRTPSPRPGFPSATPSTAMPSATASNAGSPAPTQTPTPTATASA